MHPAGAAKQCAPAKLAIEGNVGERFARLRASTSKDTQLKF
jgi:hypothetical protein